MSVVLLGLRDQPPAQAQPGSIDLAREIDGFLLRSPNPSSSDVVNFLKLYPESRHDEVSRALIAKGVSANSVSSALTFLHAESTWNYRKIGGVLAVVSAAASGFHGYRRNHSIAWGVVWFVLGGVFPVVTPVIALAQGFGKRKT